MITKNIYEVESALSNGNVVGIPTETVYGLAANAFDLDAVNDIFVFKKRPFDNPLILHTHSIHEVEKYIIEFPVLLQKIANHFWPGPLTILLPKNDKIAYQITAGSSLVAVRIPSHPLTLELIKTCKFPLVAPSANPYQRISPTNAQQVYEYFGEQIPYILDGGQCNQGIESTIIGLEKDQIIIYRQGSITIEEIRKIYKNTKLHETVQSAVITSGMSKIHYAPNTKMILVDNIDAYLAQNNHLNIGILRFNSHDHKTIASSYYKKLYEMDKLNYDLIIAEKFENIGLGAVLNTKLERAVYKFKE
jgi:L-threonylcarbamoyladenylate synthase